MKLLGRLLLLALCFGLVSCSNNSTPTRPTHEHQGISITAVSTTSIHGFKWLDANGNGRHDSDEPGLPGIIIYADLNKNSVRDDGEPSAETMEDDLKTEEDETGIYWLKDLTPGTVCVREELPISYVQTFPPGGQHVVVLEPGSYVFDIDFGNQKRSTGSVHGIKWFDENGNGRRDPGEPGLPGVIIYSDLNNNGELDPGEPRTVTMERGSGDVNEEGRYWLMDLTPMSDAYWAPHIIREIVPDGFTQTFPADSFHSVSLFPGQVLEDVDFGNKPVGDDLASIHGFKWLDRNGNGQRDDDEPGLAGVTIYLDYNNNGALDDNEPRTRTMEDSDNTPDVDEEGMYWLTEILSGLYAVREIVPDGFIQTFPSIGVHLIQLEDGEVVTGVDFGNFFEETPEPTADDKWDRVFRK